MNVFKYVLDRADLDVILSYNHYTLQNTMLADLVPYLKGKGVGIMNAAPFSARLLTNAPLPPWHKATPEVRQLCRQAADHCGQRGVDIAQLALQFSLAHPDMATCIVGSANPANVRLGGVGTAAARSPARRRGAADFGADPQLVLHRGTRRKQRSAAWLRIGHPETGQLPALVEYGDNVIPVIRCNFSITLGHPGLESRLQAVFGRKPPEGGTPTQGY